MPSRTHTCFPRLNSAPRILLSLGVLFVIYLFLSPLSLSSGSFAFSSDSSDAGSSSHYWPWEWNWPWDWDLPWPWRGRNQFSLEFCVYDDSPATRPHVALPDETGSVRGVKCTYSGLEAFLGIPYAQPPVSNLRFNAPAALPKNASREFTGSQYGKMCLQYTAPDQPRWAMSEDCLSVNVVRPLTPQKASPIALPEKLPVMVWFYGGGLESGSGMSFNATRFVMHSIERGKPVIFVSFNYRLSALGFLASSELAEAATSGNAAINAGLYDMHSVLLWVQRNIEAFGGDKNKVTVFGQSAGAIGIGSLLLADGGQAVSDLNLFRGTIMQSGAPMADGNRLPKATDSIYKSLLEFAGCSSPSASSQQKGLACLRSISEDAVVQAIASASQASHWRRPFDRAQDGYFHAGTAAENVRTGKIAVVPILAGNVLDEGTVFAPNSINNKAGIEEYIKGFLPEENFASFGPSLNTVLKLYPDDPRRGSPYEPYRTSERNRFYGRTNQYKRMASLIGDTLFESGRRALLDAVSKKAPANPTFAYQFAVHIPDIKAALGIPHSAELAFVNGKVAEMQPSSNEGAVSTMMMDAWLNFVWSLDPNGDGVPRWPRYGPGKQMLRINTRGTKIIKDDYRAKEIAYLSSSNWTTLLDL